MLDYTVLEQMQSLFENLNPEEFEILLKGARPFKKLMTEYESALIEVETKLRVLNLEFSIRKEGNPIDNIKTRLKKPVSLIKKLKKLNLKLTKEDIEENIFDIAGIRVICFFVDDMYSIIQSLKNQYDLKILQEKDYIKNPKPNGYRSFHLIVEVPIFLYEKMIYKKVEIQFRTIGMDFWATIEHKIRYKKDIKTTEEIQKMLKETADISADLDNKMLIIKKLVKEEN